MAAALDKPARDPNSLVGSLVLVQEGLNVLWYKLTGHSPVTTASGGSLA